MQQQAMHVACRCDVSDGAAMTDLFAAVQRFPATDMEAANLEHKRQTDSGAYVDGLVAQAKAKAAAGVHPTQEELDHLRSIQEELKASITSLKEQSSIHGYSKENHMARLEAEDREEQIQHFLNRYSAAAIQQ